MLVGGEELAVMSYVFMLCAVLKLQGDHGPCGEPAAPSDHSVAEDTGESGLLIVSLRLGCKQVARIHGRGVSVSNTHDETLFK